MVDNPISNPGVSPTEATPPLHGPGHPHLGGDETESQKPFSLGPEGAKVAPEAASGLPSPMTVAGDSARQQAQIPSEELSAHVSHLQQQLSTIQNKIQTPSVTKNFSPDHYSALQKVTEKMNPDMQAIAKYSNGQYTPVQQAKGEPLLNHVVNWINGSQKTLQGALSFLQNEQHPNPAAYLSLQYAVQRATQRGELFASIVGSSVSGIKTIMSTQLG